jgi:hypothetical protein
MMTAGTQHVKSVCVSPRKGDDQPAMELMHEASGRIQICGKGNLTANLLRLRSFGTGSDPICQRSLGAPMRHSWGLIFNFNDTYVNKKRLLPTPTIDSTILEGTMSSSAIIGLSSIAATYVFLHILLAYTHHEREPTAVAIQIPFLSPLFGMAKKSKFYTDLR